MARIGFISDIHANWPALEAIRSDLPDFTCCLGDIVGYGPFPQETLDYVRENHRICVMGNHDYAVVAEQNNVQNPYTKAIWDWTGEVLDHESQEYLKELKFRETWWIDDMKILMSHGALWDPSLFGYILPRELEHPINLLNTSRTFESLQGQNAEIAVTGHSHIPLLVQKKPGQKGWNYVSPEKLKSKTTPQGTLYRAKLDREKLHIFNPGSVGQPRNFRPGAWYGYIESEEDNYYAVWIHKKYDIAPFVSRLEELASSAFLPQFPDNPEDSKGNIGYLMKRIRKGF